MISPVTFSAANLMAAMAKEEGIATIIGVQSSGGASSISGTVLPSGDVFFMSSTNVINVQISEGEFESVEYGVVPDYEYPGLSKLYDYEYLQNVINNLKTN
jgi:C-terminal processing protease CtpA/Prc